MVRTMGKRRWGGLAGAAAAALAVALAASGAGLAAATTSVDLRETYPDCIADLTYFADGICDTSGDKPLNVEECGYDGGDCCECTCVDGPTYPCQDGSVNYTCLDPEAPCFGDTPAPAAAAAPVADEAEEDTAVEQDDSAAAVAKKATSAAVAAVAAAAAAIAATALGGGCATTASVLIGW